MARTVTKQKYIRRTQDNKALLRVELAVDTMAELPAADGLEPGVVIAHGSTAHVINAGEVYSFNGAGEWIKQGV